MDSVSSSPIPAPLAEMLAHAQECSANAPFLDAGRTEHATLAANVQQLVHLLGDIRRMADASPHCINLAEIDRLINQATHA